MTFAATFTMTSLEADFGANLTMSPITKQSHKNILSHPFLTARCLISIQFTIFFLCLVASPLTLTLGPVFFPQVKFNVLLARNYFFWTCNLSKVLIHHCKYPKPNFKSIFRFYDTLITNSIYSTKWPIMETLLHKSWHKLRHHVFLDSTTISFSMQKHKVGRVHFTIQWVYFIPQPALKYVMVIHFLFDICEFPTPSGI